MSRILSIAGFLTALAMLITAALMLTSTASASAYYRPYYMDELKISNNIERWGFRDNGKHVNVDSAFCSGLRRFGVRTDYYGLDKFWHFDCTVDVSDGTFYDMKIKTLRHPGSRRWIWRITSSSWSW